MAAYDLFLFDLDDTLLDFKASERLAFTRLLEDLGIVHAADMYANYRATNEALWGQLEQKKVTLEHLKIERFRKTFADHRIDIDPEHASARYLEMLGETVVLMDHAHETCEWLSQRGEIGIITNGIHAVQMSRIKSSSIAPYISFISVSEMCGHAKPEVRFFEHTAAMAKKFSKASTIIVGDRPDADIQGALHFGIDSCWFNPHKKPYTLSQAPTYEIAHLAELRTVIAA